MPLIQLAPSRLCKCMQAHTYIIICIRWCMNMYTYASNYVTKYARSCISLLFLSFPNMLYGSEGV